MVSSFGAFISSYLVNFGTLADDGIGVAAWKNGLAVGLTTEPKFSFV
jgi:hypothetical protein